MAERLRALIFHYSGESFDNLIAVSGMGTSPHGAHVNV